MTTGLEYIHVKSPEGGFDLVINVAACDSPAPAWLMAAINVMEKTKLAKQHVSRLRRHGSGRHRLAKSAQEDALGGEVAVNNMRPLGF